MFERGRETYGNLLIAQDDLIRGPTGVWPAGEPEIVSLRNYSDGWHAKGTDYTEVWMGRLWDGWTPETKEAGLGPIQAC